MKKMAEITLRMVQNFLEFKRDMNFQIKSAFQMPNRININRHIRVKLQTLKVKKKKKEQTLKLPREINMQPTKK